jgi:zinc transport system substrate-binding protein
LTIISIWTHARRVRNAARTLVATLALAASATACGSPAGSDPSRLSVVAAFYPLEYVSAKVGGDAVTVTNLTQPGAEPHDLELTTDQVRRIADAKLVVYLRGFQPQVDESVDQNAGAAAFDANTVTPLTAGDPHVWLDPTRLAAIADRVAERLAQLDPSTGAAFRERAADLRRELAALDTEYAAGLRTCARHEIVTSHAAFGYLAQRYGLRQIPITGVSPETEPSPQRLAEVAAQAKQYGVTTIFFESLVSPSVAQTLAREVGAKAEVLDPIEGIEPGSGDDYVTVMRKNLTRLRAALACT